MIGVPGLPGVQSRTRSSPSGVSRTSRRYCKSRRGRVSRPHTVWACALGIHQAGGKSLESDRIMTFSDLWKLGTPVAQILVRCLVVYFFVLAGLRLTGKREVGQMTPFDLVLILLISNAVQNAMVGPDNSLLGGLIAAAVLLLVNLALGRLVPRSRVVSNILKGHATLLINRGVVQEAHCQKEGVTTEDLMAALREHGIAHL